MFKRMGKLWMIFLVGGFLITPPFLLKALSQEPYPSRPITVIVPWGAGMTDTLTRVLGKIAERKLGQPVIVENKAGAGGAIGVNYAVKSKPDGYTLGIPVTSAYVLWGSSSGL